MRCTATVLAGYFTAPIDRLDAPQVSLTRGGHIPSGYSATMTASLPSLDRLIEKAEADLTAASNGRALCRITAVGAPARSVKFFEGSWTALRALARAVETGHESTGGETVVVAARHLRAEWQADLELRSSHPDSPWIPYCEGGIAALDQFLAAEGQ